MVTLLYLLSFVLVVAPGLACPERCYCYDDFVTCSDFTDLDLTLLPDSAETLVLTQGEMEEIPPAFFARASGLKSVEMTNFNARVVRGGAFRGLNNLDSFIIKGSSFDIVEPDGFSGVAGISKFLISDSHFGRVGKHAFAEITDVSDWRIWSSYFASLSDEAFYGIGRVHAIQLYQNNISFIGHDIFAAAYEVEYVNFYMNTINVISNGSLSHIRENADLLVVYANKFQCVCENAWITQDPAFEDYMTSNECFFSSDFSLSESLFLLSEVNEDILCPVTSPDRHRPMTTTLSVLPSIIEDVDIWSDHEGLIPKPDEVQEHLYTGNVSVNNSLHDSGVNLTAEFESISSSHNDSTPGEWSDVAATTSSSFSVEFFSSPVDSSVESDSTSLPLPTETMLSEIPMQDSSLISSSEPITEEAMFVSDVSKASSPLSSADEIVFEPRISTGISEASSSIAVSPSSISDSLEIKTDEITYKMSSSTDTSETFPYIAVSIPSIYDSLNSKNDETTFESLTSTDVAEASSSIVVPVSFSSSSLLGNDETSSFPNTVSPKDIDRTDFQPELDTFSDFLDTSSTPVVDETSSTSMEQESMTSVLSHELSSSHEDASVLSATEKSPSISNTPPSPSFLPYSSPAHETRSTSGASTLETFPTSHPTTKMTTEEKAEITSSAEPESKTELTVADFNPSSFSSSHSSSLQSSPNMASTSSSYSRSSISSSVQSSPSSPKPSPAVANDETSSTQQEIFVSSTTGSDQANLDHSKDKNQETSEHIKPKSSVSILDVITPSSSKIQEEPTVTFPVELPVDLPEKARIKAVRDKAHYEKAQQDKQIYARPYSTSAVGMDSSKDNSAASNCSFGYLSVLFTVMSFLLSKYL